MRMALLTVKRQPVLIVRLRIDRGTRAEGSQDDSGLEKLAHKSELRA
jgi:hypothetical protein